MLMYKNHTRCNYLIACGLTILFLLPVGRAAAVSPEELPVIDGEKTVATVGETQITLTEFKRALATSHTSAMVAPERKMQDAQQPGKIDYSDITKRLVDIRLIVTEAKNMGLDQQPDLREAIELYSRETLIKLLLEQHVKDIEVTDDQIEPVYRDLVREWQIRSALFKNKKAALAVEADITAGADFDIAVNKAAAEGAAEVEADAQFLKNADLSLPVAKIVATMAIGDVSPVVGLGLRRYSLFQLKGERFPEQIDRAAWDEARRRALSDKKVQAAREYFERLKEKESAVDEELLAALDYESQTPGFDALRGDKRIVAEIKGQDSITVGDLTAALGKKFFHGIQQAIAGKRVNAAKDVKLEEMLHDRILLAEALKKGLDRTEEYRLAVREYENALIFGSFTQKIIAPEIKLTNKELQQYYRDNIDQFAAPRMIRIRSLAFAKKSTAIDAIDKLTQGTDFDWLSANADDLANPNKPGLIRFDGRLLTQRGLPQEIQEVVKDANTGDYRLYSDENLGIYYVLQMEQVVVPGPRSFAEVRQEIAEDLFAEKMKAAIDTWTDQLRRYYPVKIYLTNAQ